VFGVHLTGEGDSTPEAAAAEQAVKRARQGGAEGASGAVFAALEAAEAQHSRQQQGKHWCACPSCHAHTPVRSCILKQIDSYQHIAVLSCAALCCAVLCCAVLCCAVLCCAVLCCAVLCCAVLCCAVLCCAVLAAQQSHGPDEQCLHQPNIYLFMYVQMNLLTFLSPPPLVKPRGGDYVSIYPSQPSRHVCLQITLNTDARHCAQGPTPVVLHATSIPGATSALHFIDAKAPNPA